MRDSAIPSFCQNSPSIRRGRRITQSYHASIFQHRLGQTFPTGPNYNRRQPAESGPGSGPRDGSRLNVLLLLFVGYLALEESCFDYDFVLAHSTVKPDLLLMRDDAKLADAEHVAHELMEHQNQRHLTSGSRLQNCKKTMCFGEKCEWHSIRTFTRYGPASRPTTGEPPTRSPARRRSRTLPTSDGSLKRWANGQNLVKLNWKISFCEKDTDHSGSLTMSELWIRYTENDWYNQRYQVWISTLRV